MDCLFCKIAKKEKEAQIVYEDAKTMAFLDINQRAPGHTMVISKVHSENILDLPDSELKPVFLTVKKVITKLNSALKPHGFTIAINHGKAAGQVIDHLHIHLLPRFADDGGGSIHSVVNNPSNETLIDLAEKIKSS